MQTNENAVESVKLWQPHRLDRGLRITDAVGLFRAVRCFHKQGVEVMLAACHHR